MPAVHPRANLYQDPVRADAYASLGIAGTYAIAFRALEAALAPAASVGPAARDEAGSERALDFGCGAGRSTRFLVRLGFDVVGVDISAEMVARARVSDPGGDYRVIAPTDLESWDAGSFALILIGWALDNVHAREEKAAILRRLGRLLGASGRLYLVASTPELYRNEWATFTTAPFPENATARSGDVVRIRIKGSADARPYEDTLCDDRDYRALFAQAGLALRGTLRPRGRPDEGEPWISELATPPWVIYELVRSDAG